MAGPALSQLHSHRAIHEGGLSGAIQKTDHFLALWQEGKLEEANHAADVLLDYWETRVISHADTEESGFYEEKVKHNEALIEAVIQRFHALLTVNEIHSREEERLLF